MHVEVVFNVGFEGTEETSLPDGFNVPSMGFDNGLVGYKLETPCERAFVRNGFLTIVGGDGDTYTSLNYPAESVIFFKVKGLNQVPAQEFSLV